MYARTGFYSYTQALLLAFFATPTNTEHTDPSTYTTSRAVPCLGDQLEATMSSRIHAEASAPEAKTIPVTKNEKRKHIQERQDTEEEFAPLEATHRAKRRKIEEGIDEKKKLKDGESKKLQKHEEKLEKVRREQEKLRREEEKIQLECSTQFKVVNKLDSELLAGEKALDAEDEEYLETIRKKEQKIERIQAKFSRFRAALSISDDVVRGPPVRIALISIRLASTGSVWFIIGQWEIRPTAHSCPKSPSKACDISVY